MNFNFIILLLFFSINANVSVSQIDTTQKEEQRITVTGTVKEKTTKSVLLNTLIIQKGVSGKFIKPDGTFSITIRKKDTLLISATGYNIVKLCYKDSSKTEYTVNILMEKLTFYLAEQTILPKRDLKEIHDDFDDLRVTLPPRPEGVDAISSPVSALYTAFSKIEKSKRKVAEMEYEDQKKDLLKELFRVYVDADIINLSPDEFERFIFFTNMSDDFLQNASEYELISFIQQRFKEYLALKQ